MSCLSDKRAKCCFALTIVLLGLVASSFILTAFADTTLFDDQGTNFWSVYNGGSGSIVATITTETSVVHSGSSSLKQVISPGTYGIVGFYHIFSPPVGWSTYSGVSFWLYGSNSGWWINFVIFDKNANDYLDMIQDNFNGWKQFTLNFADAFSSGNVDLANIYAVEFAFGNPAPAQLYVDQMVLIGGSSPSPSSNPSPSPTASPIASPTAAPTPSPTSPSQTSSPPPASSSPSPTPASGGNIFFPTATSTSSPSASPKASGRLTVYLMNGNSPVTEGVVTIGSFSVSISSSGSAVFTGLVPSFIYHMTIVVNGVTVYDNQSFVIPANGAFTVNLAPKNSTQTSWTIPQSLLIVAALFIIAIVAVIIVLRKRRHQ